MKLIDFIKPRTNLFSCRFISCFDFFRSTWSKSVLSAVFCCCPSMCRWLVFSYFVRSFVRSLASTIRPHIHSFVDFSSSSDNSFFVRLHLDGDFVHNVRIFTLLLSKLLLSALVVMLICSHIINSANRPKCNSFGQRAYGNAMRREILFISFPMQKCAAAWYVRNYVKEKIECEIGMHPKRIFYLNM